METHEYACHDGVGLSTLIRRGEVSATEVEQAARSALTSMNEKINGLAAPLFTPALEHGNGPFSGVPFLIKDIGPMARGVRFFCGSRALGPGVPAQEDHELMSRFRAAGLVTMGLTTAPELGLNFATEAVRYGPTRNPWDLGRGVGGSSGGAAALVAAGAVALAHGNDGAGSLRIPASCCGLVGLKPSRGRTPVGTDTGMGLLGMLSEFALTRTVRDTAWLLDAVAGPAPGDPFAVAAPTRRFADEVTADPGRLRVAVTTRAWSGGAVDGEVAQVAVRAAECLAGLGHHVDVASPAVDWESVVSAVAAEAAAAAAPFLLAPRQPPAERLEAVSRVMIAAARERRAVDLVAGLNAAGRVSRTVAGFFSDTDLLVTPTLAQPPAPHGTLNYDEDGYTVESWLRRLFDHGPFTAVFNITGQPAISLPLGESAGGLPIGVQVVAAHGREDLLLQVAAQLERALPWAHRTPTVHASRR
ncbi:amidase [Frankia sp. R43]|uniref:amidase n=1 Tax=Frankia sp. R43 TaxID=269536 RepID=UPI0006CA1319|nr:amidase family protein [Frankia sp. R43]KPM53567.1 amidase [Frankia sp. R43]